MQLTQGTVTPEIAATYLSLAAPTRNLSAIHVRKIAGDVAAGRFTLSPHPICFDRRGRLVDGQHRLHAVVMAGVAVEMMVAEDVSDEEVLNIDRGRQRSFTDSEASAGRPIPKSYAATVRWMFPLDEEMTPAKLRELSDTHRDAVNFAMSLFNGRGSSTRHVHTGTVMGVVARAVYDHPESRLAAFVEVLKTGIMCGPGDVAAIKLREYLMSGQKGQRLETYWKTQRALDAFLREEGESEW